VVLSGLKKKVPNVLSRKDQFGEKERFDSDTIWEEETIAQKIMAQRATAMIQNTLFMETVLFSFKASDFQHHTEAYKLVNDNVGEIISGIPITKYGNPQRNELIIEVKFCNPTDGTKAVKEGFVFKDILYKGVPANDGANDKLVRLSLSQLPFFVSRQELSDGLRQSLGRFGKVCQVKRLTNRGYFEGEAVVILDISPQDDAPWHQLERRLHLATWDIVVPASFKGAPPICFLCRQSGHIRKNCPRLEHVTCFNCKGKGHYARHCPEPKANEGQQLDDYLESTQKVSEKVRDQQGRTTKRTKATKEQVVIETPSNDGINESQLHTETATNDAQSTETDQGEMDEVEYEEIMETDRNNTSAATTKRKLPKKVGSSKMVRKTVIDAFKATSKRTGNGTTPMIQKQQLLKQLHEQQAASQANGQDLSGFSILPPTTDPATGRLAHD
jgi:hypothetical protein